MEIQRKIIESKLPPANKNVWWYNPYEGVINKYNNGSWVSIDTKKPLPSDPIVPSGLSFPEELEENPGMILYSNYPIELEYEYWGDGMDSTDCAYSTPSTDIHGAHKLKISMGDVNYDEHTFKCLTHIYVRSSSNGDGGSDDAWLTIFINDYNWYLHYEGGTAMFWISNDGASLKEFNVHVKTSLLEPNMSRSWLHGASFSEEYPPRKYNVFIWSPEQEPLFDSENYCTICYYHSDSNGTYCPPDVLYVPNNLLQEYKDIEIESLTIESISNYENNAN